MKRIILLVIFCFCMLAARAQQKPDSTAVPVAATDQPNGTTRQQYLDSRGAAFNNSISANSKKDFWGLLGTVGSVFDNTASGISVNPTLDKLKIFGKGDWLKNVQLNFTPVTKGANFLKYDSLSFGVTWAIINNYTQQQWKKLDLTPAIQRYMELNQLLLRSVDPDRFRHRYPGSNPQFSPADEAARAAISKKMNSKAITAADLKGLPLASKIFIVSQLNGLPGDIPDTVKKTKAFAKLLDKDKKQYLPLYASYPTSLSQYEQDLIDGVLVSEFNAAFSSVDNVMKKKQQLNLAVSTDNNFVTHRWQGIYIAPNYTNYFGKYRQFAYAIKTAYSLEVDTLHPSEGLKRQLLKSTGSLDYQTPWKNPNDPTLAFLELKMAAEDDWVLAGQYAKEMKNAVSPVLTVTLNITPEFSLPFSVKYDTKKANFFGFLSVQYAISNTSSKK